MSPSIWPPRSTPQNGVDYWLWRGYRNEPFAPNLQLGADYGAPNSNDAFPGYTFPSGAVNGSSFTFTPVPLFGPGKTYGTCTITWDLWLQSQGNNNNTLYFLNSPATFGPGISFGGLGTAFTINYSSQTWAGTLASYTSGNGSAWYQTALSCLMSMTWTAVPGVGFAAYTVSVTHPILGVFSANNASGTDIAVSPQFKAYWSSSSPVVNPCTFRNVKITYS
jgi:hypothetical protein